MNTTQTPTAQRYGVVYRRLQSLGGELRAFVVTADSKAGAIAAGLNKLAEAGLQYQVESIDADKLGFEGTNEFVDRHHDWCIGIVRQGGNVINI